MTSDSCSHSSQLQPLGLFCRINIAAIATMIIIRRQPCDAKATFLVAAGPQNVYNYNGNAFNGVSLSKLHCRHWHVHMQRMHAAIAIATMCDKDWKHKNNPRFVKHQLLLLATSFLSPPEISGSRDDKHSFGDNKDQGESSSRSLSLEGLNPSQVKAVTQLLWDEGSSSSSRRLPSSVVTRTISVTGSGKTKVLTTRIAHLLHKDPHGEILTVTFA